MRAIILAAGRGSRMGDLTEEYPKCLTQFAGRTLLEWQLSAMSNTRLGVPWRFWLALPFRYKPSRHGDPFSVSPANIPSPAHWFSRNQFHPARHSPSPTVLISRRTNSPTLLER